MPSTSKVYGAATAAAAAVIVAGGIGYAATRPNTDVSRVDRVVDGDTVVVDYGRGPETIRVIGLDTPETVSPEQRRGAPPECYGPQASARAKQLLEGQTVTVADDETQQTRDRYGRRLARITLPDRQDFSIVMLREGLARAYKVRGPEPTGWAELEAAQKAAQDARTGLWGACPA